MFWQKRQNYSIFVVLLPRPLGRCIFVNFFKASQCWMLGILKVYRKSDLMILFMREIGSHEGNSSYVSSLMVHYKKRRCLDDITDGGPTLK